MPDTQIPRYRQVLLDHADTGSARIEGADLTRLRVVLASMPYAAGIDFGLGPGVTSAQSEALTVEQVALGLADLVERLRSAGERHAALEDELLQLKRDVEGARRIFGASA